MSEAGSLKKTHIEGRIVCHHNAGPKKFQECGKRSLNRRAVSDHRISDSRQDGDHGGDLVGWPHEGGKFANDFTATNLDGPDLRNRITGLGSSGFEVNDDKCHLVQRGTQIIKTQLTRGS